MSNRPALLRNLRPSLIKPLRTVSKVLPVVALVGCLYLLGERLAHFEPNDLIGALRQLSAWQWVGAGLLTGISFLAVGQYDAVIHRVLGTGVAPARARAAGVRAIALSQTVGFSSLSGGLVRIRCLPELDLWTVSRLSVLVSLSFLASWAVLTGGVVLWGHNGPAYLILVFLGLIGWRVAGFRPTDSLPGLSPRVGIALLFWTTIDTSAAALVLGVLLPPDMMPGFHTLFVAFLVALGAGLLSQSPAGLGAFELSLLALMPQVDQASLLAAVLAYRIIYFMLPALIALACLIKPAVIPLPADLQRAEGAARARALARAPQADWLLAYQGADVVLGRDQATGWLLRQTGSCLVALGRPLGRADLSDFRNLARQRGLVPALYKSDARTAVRARAAGWKTILIAQNALISVPKWSVDQPACRQLRRKLRSLQQAKVRIEVDPLHLPLARMQQVAQEWSERNGGEKGFSMGQFDPVLLARQRVMLAYQGDKLLGFVSFHAGRDNWALDLMRQRADAPDGTMHGLVHAAIAAAAHAGIVQVSLAAVPLWPGAMAGVAARMRGMAGLRQFKTSFGPKWEPLYLCSPGWAGLIQATMSVTCAIHAKALPRLIRGAFSQNKSHKFNQAQQDHAHFQFETALQACDAQRVTSRAAVIACPADRPQLTGRPDDKRPFPPA